MSTRTAARRGIRSTTSATSPAASPNVLKADGLARGDRVAVFLSQSLEPAHRAYGGVPRRLGCRYRCFALFGEDALEFRLSNSGAKAIITTRPGGRSSRKSAIGCHICKTSTSPAMPSTLALNRFGHRSKPRPDEFITIDTFSRRSGLIIYTSGHHGKSEGRAARPPRGARHLPNVEMCHDFLPRPGDLMWDAGRLGVDRRAHQRAVRRVVSCRADRRASRPQIRAAGGDADDGRSRRTQRLPAPTALKLMRQADVKHSSVKLRSIFTGGESLGGELLGLGARDLRHRRP